jgi:ferredoxin-type protein NapF
MALELARRDLFRGRFTRPAETRSLRPPTALVEAAFRAACDGCLACVSACPEKVIRLDGDRRPVLQFVHGECTFCGDCADACPTGALAREGARPWTAEAEIGGRCLAIGGVHCRSCGDACPTSAIRFSPRADGRFLPILAESTCNGCGACVSVCPAGAVEIHQSQSHEGVTA